eukprot:g29539.t1
MNPVATQPQTADGHTTYIVPSPATQLPDIAKKANLFDSASDPDTFLNEINQQSVIAGLDTEEQTKLIIMCLSPAGHSAFHEGQQQGRETLDEMKALVLTAVGQDKA